MSEGAANEAKIVVSTDWSSFREFLEGSKKGLDDVGAKGKGAFGDLGKTVTDFAKNTLQGAFMGVGMQLFDAVISPLRKGFSQLIADAEQFRGVVARTAVATGQSFGATEQQLDELSKKTGLKVEQIDAYLRQVRSITGDQKGAVASLEGARREALARGGDVGEMAGEVGALQTRYKIEDVEGFYNRQRSGAKALGLNENLAAETFRRMMPSLSRTSMSADAAGRFSNAMLQATGGDMGMAVEAAGTMSGFVGGHLPYIEKTLQDSGYLKKGEVLHDKLNRPDVGRALELMQKFQKDRRGQKGLDWVSMLHLPGATGALFSRAMESISASADAQLYADQEQPLAAAAKAYDESEEGRSQRTSRRIESEDRAGGKAGAAWKQRVREMSGGGFWGWTKPFTSAKGVRVVLGEDPEVLEAHRKRMAEREREAREGMARRQAAEAEGHSASFWRPTGGASPIPLGRPEPAAPAQAADPKALAAEQGKELGKTLQTGQGIPVIMRGPVQIEMVPPGRPGLGGQR